MEQMNHNTDGSHRSSSSGPGSYLMGASTLTGDAVVNRQGEVLGDIREIMLNVSSGKVEYAVLAFGGFMGIGGKLFAVPWRALVLDAINRRFMLNVSKDRFAHAPGFDKAQWPDMADPTWAAIVHDFYGTDLYSE